MNTERAFREATLKGQIAVVTGAGRGIGRTMAMMLAKAGATVAVVARSADQIQETATLISEESGRALAFQTDVTQQFAVEELIRNVEQRLGPVDLLVNNAGGGSAVGPAWEVDAGQWWDTIVLNLQSTFLCSRSVLPGMIARRRGRIINLASNVAIRPSPYYSAYSCAKAAVLRLTDSLAAETREHGVAVFAVSPGMVRTALNEHLLSLPETRKWAPWLHSLTDKDWSPADLVGHLVIWLAEGHGDALSGRFIHVSDNVELLLERSEEIEREDLYALRLRRLSNETWPTR